jgi:hypothetical protein
MSDDRQAHQDRVERLLGTSSDNASSSTRREGENGKEAGASFTDSASASRVRNHDATPKARCAGMKKDGTPCRAYALGDAYGDASHLCSGHAGLGGRKASGKASGKALEHLRDDAKELEQGDGAATRRRTPLAVLREKVEADPEKYVALWEKAAERGSDIRALSAIFKLIYEDDAGHVDEPHTLDELAKLTRSERRQLITQLEAAGRAQPFRADAWRAGRARGEDERRAELATLSAEERRLLTEDLAALG